MSAAVIALLSILGQIAGATGSTQIASIISFLTSFIPTLIKEVEDVVPFVKNIITALQSNAAITPEQLAQLTALDAQVDQAFEAAAAAAQAEDVAADPNAPTT